MIVFTLKRKCLGEWLEKYGSKSIYFEIYTKKQLLQAIDIIKNLE